jgi:ankyrin repeat protein
MKILQTTEVNNNPANVAQVTGRTKPQNEHRGVESPSPIIGSGQRRLRTEMQLVTGSRILLAQAVQGAPVDQEFIDVLMKYGNVPKAVSAKDFHATEVLLKNGAKPDGGSLCLAIETLDIRFVELLLSYGAQPTPIDLERAWLTNDIRLVELLINHGAKPTSDSINKATSANNISLVELLLKRGAKPDKESLTVAVLTRNIRLVELLLQYNAAPNTRSSLESSNVFCPVLGKYLTSEGMTPLDAAVKNNNTDILIALLKAGADPTILRKVGSFERPVNGTKLQQEYNVLVSPVYIALKNRDYLILRAFAQFRADFNKPCGLRTPLQVAICMQDAEAVRILLEGGAKP